MTSKQQSFDTNCWKPLGCKVDFGCSSQEVKRQNSAVVVGRAAAATKCADNARIVINFGIQKLENKKLRNAHTHTHTQVYGAETIGNKRERSVVSMEQHLTQPDSPSLLRVASNGKC